VLSRSPIATVAAIGLALLLAPAAARAQADAAETAFALGNAAVDAGDYVTAEARYAEAAALLDSDRYHLNHALALEHLGRLGDARRAAERVTRDPILRDEARALIARLPDDVTDHAETDEQRLPSSDVAGPTLDARETAPAAREAPAAHVISHGSQRSSSVLDTRNDVAGVEQERNGGSITTEWWFWTLVGVAVGAAAATTTAVLVDSSNGPMYTPSSVGVIDVGG
jgi:hypothetical protein